MIANRLFVRIALVLLAGVSLVQCGDGGGSDDDPAEIVVTSSPTTPTPDFSPETPVPLTPTVTPSEEPFPGTTTVTPTVSITDGNGLPSPACTVCSTPGFNPLPICTPSPPPGFAFGRRLR